MNALEEKFEKVISLLSQKRRTFTIYQRERRFFDNKYVSPEQREIIHEFILGEKNPIANPKYKNAIRDFLQSEDSVGFNILRGKYKKPEIEYEYDFEFESESEVSELESEFESDSEINYDLIVIDKSESENEEEEEEIQVSKNLNRKRKRILYD